MTGLPGRPQLVARLAEAAATAGASTLIVVRVRKLAAVEEVMGEAAVVRVLAHVAREMAAFGDGANVVADLGDATFAVLRASTAEGPEDLARRVVSAVARPVAINGTPLYAAANAGVIVVDPGQGDAEAHLERALGALQQAMSKGPGFIELVSDARAARAVEDWEMRTLLEEASLRGELRLEYQTIQAAAGGPILKVEALLRWESARLGRVGPHVFIPLLEESGGIRAVGEWVLGEACRQVRLWRAETGLPIRASINVSPVQLAASDFAAAACAVAAAARCDPSWIELEITEGALIRSFAEVRGQMDALAAAGFTLAIDDFGAGHSSLGQLAQLPVHTLKMDRSLIADLPGSGKRAGVVKAIVALADALGLAVTAEGVERAEQAAWLERFIGMECQGYHFSRPMTGEKVRELFGRS